MERKKSPLAPRRFGFTITDLLVSIGICSLLLAIALPAIVTARESARLVQCKNNLHQIGIAMQTIVSSKGVFSDGEL